MVKNFYKKLMQNELVILAQKNDYKALEELLKREQSHLFTMFRYLVKEREVVSDLTQETLMRIAKNINTLKNPKTYKSWLNHIAINLYYDYMRKISKKPALASIDASETEEACKCAQIPDFRPRPPEQAMSAELDKCIKLQILNLPEHFRIAIILRELQGLSYEEIAESTHSSLGTVKSRIARARLKLQENLKNYI